MDNLEELKPRIKEILIDILKYNDCNSAKLYLSIDGGNFNNLAELQGFKSKYNVFMFNLPIVEKRPDIRLVK
jgi:hypothetical protein